MKYKYLNLTVCKKLLIWIDSVVKLPGLKNKPVYNDNLPQKNLKQRKCRKWVSPSQFINVNGT